MKSNRLWPEHKHSPWNAAVRELSKGLHAAPYRHNETQFTDQQWLAATTDELMAQQVRAEVIDSALDRVKRHTESEFASRLGTPRRWVRHQIARWQRIGRPVIAVRTPYVGFAAAAVARAALVLTLCALGATLLASSGLLASFGLSTSSSTVALPVVLAVVTWVVCAPCSQHLLDVMTWRTLPAAAHLAATVAWAGAMLGVIGWFGTGGTGQPIAVGHLWSAVAVVWAIYAVLSVADGRRWRTFHTMSDRAWKLHCALGLYAYVTGHNLSDARREVAALASNVQPGCSLIDAYGPPEDVVSLYLQGAKKRLCEPSPADQMQRRRLWILLVTAVLTVVMSIVLVACFRHVPEQSFVGLVGVVGGLYRSVVLWRHLHTTLTTSTPQLPASESRQVSGARPRQATASVHRAAQVPEPREAERDEPREAERAGPGKHSQSDPGKHTLS